MIELIKLWRETATPREKSRIIYIKYITEKLQKQVSLYEKEDITFLLERRNALTRVDPPIMIAYYISKCYKEEKKKVVVS